ncbi:hypothetical protein JCM8202v2_004297 [Rhodotorula sphaerocarpa]
MSLLESRRRVVPSLWDRVFKREFDAVERMFAPGFAYEVFPSTYRPFFAPLPTTGLFDPLETVDYFKAIREKLLTEPTSMEVKEQSMGENSLQSRFVTQGRDAEGKPYDIRHSLFLEFDEGDKIKRGVEYLESDSMDLHLKREKGKDWAPISGSGEGAQKQVEGQQQQPSAGAGAVEGKPEETAPSASQQQAESQSQSQSQRPAGSQASQPHASQASQPTAA